MTISTLTGARGRSVTQIGENKQELS